MYNVIKTPAKKMNADYADPEEEGEGWGQEENVYHVLEGPAMDGEGPQDEATVYEVYLFHHGHPKTTNYRYITHNR